MSHAAASLLIVLSAAFYGVSFSPLSASAIAWITLVPFLVAVSKAPPGRAAVYGVLFGLAATCTVAWWLPGMLAGYFGLPAGAGWLAFLTIGVGMVGIYFAAFGAWVSWLANRHAATPWRIAGAWVVCEFARANLLVPSPLALIGYTQAHAQRVVQIADATGPYGVGLLIAAVNACLAGVLAPGLRARGQVFHVGTVAAALTGALLYGQWRLATTLDDGVPVRIAVVQGAVEPSLRSTMAQRMATVEQYVARTREAAAGGASLVVWPEYAVDFYLQEDSRAQRAILGLSHEIGADVILGGPHYARDMGQTRYHNSAFLVRDGRFVDRSDKLRLVPFAEESSLPWLLPRRELSYEPGRSIRVLPTSTLRVGVLMCGESMLPALVRRIAASDADVLANLSNDGWFGHEAGARQQLDSAVLRAVENRRYLVRATTTGFSAIIDPRGRLLATSAFGRPEVVTGSVHPSHITTPYQRWGDTFAWLAAAFVVASTFRVARKHRGGKE
jgi:apolipoprotein N-acyltransferase